MSAHDPALRPPHGLRRWFGRTGEVLPTAGAAPSGPPPPTGSPLRMVRARLLGDIGDFLSAHDLDVNCFTLAVAHDYLTAADHQLVRRIDARVHASGPITVEWLEQAVKEQQGEDNGAATARLMEKLQSNLDEFGRTTHAAQNAATDYGSALETHVGQLSATGQPGAMICELAGLARAMLNRTRELEREMARSDLQTRSLRRGLDQARRSAAEDHLTGLPNRRAFEQRLASEHALAQANGENLIVAFCDIDHFKRINDSHGHDAGDRVLRTVAQSLARISGDKCHIARHGGEEFAILFRGRTLHEAWELLDDTRAEMAERRLVNRATDQPFGKITYSGGLASVFAYADTRVALRAADLALYRAKDEGRNRILIASCEVEEGSTTRGSAGAAALVTSTGLA